MNEPLLPEKKERPLTEEAFEQLLTALAPERNAAAEKYEQIRQALITYYTFRGATDPYGLADETFNRAAHRLRAGSVIFANQPVNYFLGIARNIWRENLAHPQKIVSFDTIPLPELINLENPQEKLLHSEQQLLAEKRFMCLTHCLQNFSPAEQELLISYYHGQGSAKMENRLELAARFGVSPKTLRNRTCLLRAKLLEHMKKCLSDNFQEAESGTV